MATHDLQQIIDDIIVVQKTIATPTDEKAIAKFYDETPGSVSVFPCFVNKEEEWDGPGEWGAGGRSILYTIKMQFVFAAAEQKYSERSLRKWHRPILDAFGKNVKLNDSAGIGASWIVGGDFEPVTFGQTEYIAAIYRLTVRVQEPFESVA